MNSWIGITSWKSSMILGKWIALRNVAFQGYVRGRAKKWFDFEINLRTRKQQEYFIFLGLAISKGFKIYNEVPGDCISRGIKRKRKNKLKLAYKNNIVVGVLKEPDDDKSEQMDLDTPEPSIVSSAQNQMHSVPMDTSNDIHDRDTHNLAKGSELADHPVMRAQHFTQNNPKLKFKSKSKAHSKPKSVNYGSIIPYLAVAGPRKVATQAKGKLE